MLSDEDIQKLCRGRLIKAKVYKSSGKDATEPHWAVMMDSDQEIAEHDTYFCVVISNDTTIDPDHIIPVPAYSGRTGYFQCGWVEQIDLAGIIEIGRVVELPHLKQIDAMVRKARKAKRRPSTS